MRHNNNISLPYYSILLDVIHSFVGGKKRELRLSNRIASILLLWGIHTKTQQQKTSNEVLLSFSIKNVKQKNNIYNALKIQFEVFEAFGI